MSCDLHLQIFFFFFFFIVSVIQQHKIIIQNNYGKKLVGVLHETGSTELVILCHGFRSTKEQNTMVNLAAALEKAGISSFRFDFAGNGIFILEISSSVIAEQRGTDDALPYRESEGLFQFGNYQSEADDLHAVVSHFCREKCVPSAILGHSKGGNVVLLYASRYNDVRTVVNVSGRFNLERGIANGLGEDFLQRIKKDGFIDVKNKSGTNEYRVTEESLMDRLTTDMRAACLSIMKDCRVLTVHGSVDEIIPIEDALEIAKLIPNHKLHIVEGADHGYTSHQIELASIVLDFIRAGPQQDKDMPNQWTPLFKSGVEPSLVPIWVSLPHLPFHLFNPLALKFIGGIIGKVLKIDGLTKACSRPSVARLCIEVELMKKNPDRFWLVTTPNSGLNAAKDPSKSIKEWIKCSFKNVSPPITSVDKENLRLWTLETSNQIHQNCNAHENDSLVQDEFKSPSDAAATDPNLIPDNPDPHYRIWESSSPKSERLISSKDSNICRTIFSSSDNLQYKGETIDNGIKSNEEEESDVTIGSDDEIYNLDVTLSIIKARIKSKKRPTVFISLTNSQC
ncbi:hypothetical protein HHK36_025489 [Tetracentron sinense]|uniref:Serine aminopeptidase S33 domain-containing protein n=1 Tax=Tetracentron sinense TaxID=13715 RepID=A0A834YHL8_TETSI|nr:hypothetical protein HHK36_025489 [Tetracentron sinense]